MQTTLDKWVWFGLAGLPLYGALTLWASLNPQPNPDTQFTQWAQYVTTDIYLIKHLLGSALGLVFGLFGSLALGAFLTRGRASGLALTAMSVSLLGIALFLILVGVSTFAAPLQGHAHLAGIEELAQLPATLGDAVLGVLLLGVIAFNFIGNVLFGIAIWRSRLLPKWAGALWAAAPVLMYALGAVYALVINGHSTPPTVPVGAAVMVISGLWLLLSTIEAFRSAQEGGVHAVHSNA
jgi:hypothetical protein